MIAADWLVACLAALIALWSLMGVVFPTSWHLRWNIARALHTRFGMQGVRFLFLIVILGMAFVLYRLMGNR